MKLVGMTVLCLVFTSVSAVAQTDLVAVQPVVLRVSSGLDEATGSPPPADTSILTGSSFVVELWAQQLVVDPGPPHPICGLTCVFADLGFDDGVMSCTGVTPAQNYNLLDSGACAVGLVNELGGCSFDMGLGITPQWVRIASVNMTADIASGNNSIESAAATTTISLCAFGNVPVAQIDFRAAPPFDIVAGCETDEECNDGIECTSDWCDAGHECQHAFTVAGTPCSPDENDCTRDECDGTGACAHPAKPDGTNCDDGKPGTIHDACLDGVCQGEPAEEHLVAVVPIVMQTASGLDEATGSPPPSDASILAGSSFVVELWAQQLVENPGPPHPICGLTCIFVDLGFDDSVMSCVDVTPAPNYDSLDSGACAVGLVDEVGGCSFDMGLGITPQWVRIASVNMAADVASENNSIESAAATTTISLCAFGNVPVAQIDFRAAPPFDIACPAGPVIFVDPLSGTVDARQPYPPANAAQRQGVSSVRVRGRAGIDNVICWTLCETRVDGTGNAITSVVNNGDGTFSVNLARTVSIGAVSTLTYRDGGGARSIGVFTSHPANVDADSASGPVDILAIIDILNLVRPAPWGNYSCDVDQSRVCGPADILRVIDLLNGADQFDPWLGVARPQCGVCCP